MNEEPVVFVVDDDAAIRDSLVLLLSLKGIRTLAFANADSVLQAFDAKWRGCFLVDLRMPGLSGIELLKALRDRGSLLPLIIMTAHGDVPSARAALKGGALDFLEKPIDDEVLFEVLDSAFAELGNAGSGAAESHAPRGNKLTQREKDVLRYAAQGMQNKQIANELGISPRTVEVYKARMMEKIGANSIADVVRFALETGDQQ